MKSSKERNFENSESEEYKMMKKGLARVSVFMMAAAIAASVAACTPQDKKGGEKTQTETTVQAKASKIGRAHV